MCAKSNVMKRKFKRRMWTTIIFLSLFSFFFFINATSRVEIPGRAMKYSSRSLKDAAIWQSDVRNKLWASQNGRPVGQPG